MAFVAAPVAAWALGAGASAAVAAVAGAVAVGVVTGAVLGAVTAAISGENILEGALKGAVVGGITAGVFSGLGMVAANAGVGNLTAANQLSTMGVTASTPNAAVPTVGLGSAGGNPGLAAVNTSAAAPVAAAAPTASSGTFGMSDSTTEIVAGVGKGAAEALLAPEEDTAIEQKQWQLANNLVPEVKAEVGTFKKQTSNVQVPDYWRDKYNVIPEPKTNTIVPQQGILA